MPRFVPHNPNAKVVKQVENQAPAHGVSFNLEDVASRANEYLTKVKLEAGRIVTDARRQAEAIQQEHETAQADAVKVRAEADRYRVEQEAIAKKQGHAEGFKSGTEAGHAQATVKVEQEFNAMKTKYEAEYEQRVQDAAQEQLAAHIQTLMPAIGEAAQYVAETKHQWTELWDRSAIKLLCAISERVIRRELSADPKITMVYMREALELAAGSASLKIYLNPKDYETLLPQVETLVHELASVAKSEITADPKVTLGGCRIETPYGVIDQQIESQLEKIAEELV